MYTQTIPVGKTSLFVGAVGPKEAEERGIPRSWSLRQMQQQKDVAEHFRLAKALQSVFRKMDVHRAFAPHVAPASARIVENAILEDKIRLGDAYLYRNNSVPADGVSLNPDETFVMSAAGCPVIIATDDDHVIVAHAGRDSLIDRGAIVCAPSREHFSVVDTIVASFAERGTPIGAIKMCMLFAIPAKTFEHRLDHPEYHEYNYALSVFIKARWPSCALWENGNVFPDLEKLFVEQAREKGLCNVWAINSLALFPDLAHTHDGQDPSRRNLILVKRTA